MKHWDTAFFADSVPEPLMWSEDPGDQPLLNAVPIILTERSLRQTAKAPERPMKINVVRNGQIRATFRVRR